MIVRYTMVIVVFLLFIMPAAGVAQNHEVRGVVTDAETSETLPGVNIRVKGTTTGGSSNVDGEFNVGVNSLSDTLIFTFIGYEELEIPLQGRAELNVQMNSLTLIGEELVVIGYGAVRERDITGSVARVKIDDLSQGVTKNIQQLLQGKSAGVNVVQHSGVPSGGFSINVRGPSSITAGNEPLYVIDGVPVEAIGQLSVSDIESIEVLKDASATAIYGSRGANGVVLISTREGISGQFQIDYHVYGGIQNPSNKLDVLNADDYKEIINSLIDAGTDSESFRVGEIRHRTDWQDEIYQSAPVQNHQLSLSGGIDNTTYRISLDYVDQDGILLGSSSTRYHGRINLRSQFSSKLNLGLNLSSSYVNNENSGAFGSGAVNENAGALFAAYRMDPTLSVRNEGGSFSESPYLTNPNPVALINAVNHNTSIIRTIGSLFGEFSFTDNLNGRINVSGDVRDQGLKSFTNELIPRGRDSGGIGSFQDNRNSNWLIESTLNYVNTFLQSHRFDIVIGTSYQRFIDENASLSASNFPSTILGANNLGLGSQDSYSLGTSKSGHRLNSYFGRLNYTLFDKYLITSTVRVDGSSRFGVNHRYAVFPSVAVAWQLKDDLLQEVELINMLKIRLSWGQSGNQSIGNYPSIPTFSGGRSAVWDDQEVTGTSPTRIANPDLTWETTEQINLGLDFGLLEDRITGSMEFYRSRTHDMLLNLPIPQETGFNTMTTNIGEIENRGFEFTLNSVNISQNNFQWSTDFTMSTLKNEVIDLGGISQIVQGGVPFVDQVGTIRPGESIGSFYGWQIDGIWQENDDFSVTTDNVQPGDIKFRDINGDGAVNEQDRVILGNSLPDLQWSLGNTFNYKNFNLFVFLEASHGVHMMNGNAVESYYPINFRRNKLAEPYLKRWTPDNPSNKYPSHIQPFAQGTKAVNPLTVEDASYIKIRTVRLGYEIPHFTDVIRSATVYVTGENLYTFTDYTGIDPALNWQGNAHYRIDYSTYTSARTFLLGVRLGF